MRHFFPIIDWNPPSIIIFQPFEENLAWAEATHDAIPRISDSMWRSSFQIWSFFEPIENCFNAVTPVPDENPWYFALYDLVFHIWVNDYFIKNNIHELGKREEVNQIYQRCCHPKQSKLLIYCLKTGLLDDKCITFILIISLFWISLVLRQKAKVLYSKFGLVCKKTLAVTGKEPNLPMRF